MVSLSEASPLSYRTLYENAKRISIWLPSVDAVTMFVMKFRVVRFVRKRFAFTVVSIVMCIALFQARSQLGSYETILAKLARMDVANNPTNKIRRNHDVKKPENGRIEKDMPCGQDFVNWREKKVPKYKLNPDKFLIPTLYNGPNNQLAGFHQSVLVALLLNRTLVLPPFYEHALLGVTFRRLVDARLRVNVNKLRQLISVISMDQAMDVCNGKADAIFIANSGKKSVDYSQLVKIHMEYGLKAVDYRKEVTNRVFQSMKQYIYCDKELSDANLSNQPWWPISKSNSKWMKKILDPDIPSSIPLYSTKGRIENIRADFNAKEKCVLYWFPFRQYHFMPSPEDFGAAPPASLQNITMGNGIPLYVEILRSLQAPTFVEHLTDQFRQNVLDKNYSGYLAVHWRFDEKDFFNYLCRGSRRKKFCDEVREATNATILARAILSKIREMETRNKNFLESVYFAAPPSLSALAQSVKMELQSLVDKNKSSNTPRLYTQNDLEKFLSSRSRNCEPLSRSQFSDTLSQIEMDICMRSSAFLWSRQSTWSSRALQNRYAIKGVELMSLDGPITGLASQIIRQYYKV